MDNREYMLEEEREIDLVGMMVYIIRQWKKLLILMFFGALLGIGLTFMMAPNAADLSREKAALEAELDQLHQYQQMYDSKLAHSEGSPYLHMDPNNVYSGSLQYYVAAGEDTEYICHLLDARLNDSETTRRIMQATGLTCAEQYARELFGTGLPLYQDRLIGNADSQEGTKDNASKNAFENALVSCWTVFGNEEDARAALDVYKSVIEEVSVQCKAQFPEFDLRPLTDHVQVSRSISIFEVQERFNSELKEDDEQIQSIKKSLSGAEIAYYEAVYLYPGEREVPELFDAGVDLSGLIKWVIVCMLLAGFCWGGFYLIKYLLSDYVRNCRDMKCHGLTLIAFLGKQAGKKNPIDAMADAMEKASDVPSNDGAYLCEALNALAQEEILLCGDEQSTAIACQACSDCEKAKFTGFVHVSSEALKAAKQAQGIILLVEKNRSKHAQIRRELESCALHDIKVLGVVVIG